MNTATHSLPSHTPNPFPSISHIVWGALFIIAVALTSLISVLQFSLLKTYSPSNPPEGSSIVTSHLNSDETSCFHNPEDKRFSVLTTTTIAQDLVRELGGDRVCVISLMGPGVDPHLYKPSEHDLRLLKKSEVIVYHGLHLEAKLEDVLIAISRSKPVFRLSDAIPSENLLYSTDTPDNEHPIPDPHLWMDVSLWQQTATFLNASFQALDPQYAPLYAKRHLAYAQKLSALHEDIQALIKTIPLGKRTLITAHDAFRYYGRAYAIQIKALQGISTSSRFNLYDIQSLKSFVLKRQIHAIFAESSVSTKGLEALKASLNAENYSIDFHNTLYSDALGPPNSPGSSYLAMIRFNTTTIATALRPKVSALISSPKISLR